MHAAMANGCPGSWPTLSAWSWGEAGFSLEEGQAKVAVVYVVFMQHWWATVGVRR
jgi:hypothetical protein